MKWKEMTDSILRVGLRTVLFSLVCISLTFYSPEVFAQFGDAGIEVQVQGEGTTFDAALQSAYSKAVGKALGQYVKAETVVENDRLIRDEVLTHARGIVNSWEVTRRWGESGLKYVEVTARVSRAAMGKRLSAAKIPFDGELLKSQIDNQFKIQNENAAKIIARELELLGPDQFYDVLINDNPKKSATSGQYRLTFTADLRVNAEKWTRAKKELNRSFKQVTEAGRRPITIVSESTNGSGKPTQLFSSDALWLRALSSSGPGSYRALLDELNARAEETGDNWTYAVFLLSSMRNRGPRQLETTWNIFRLSAPLSNQNELLSRNYEVVVDLISEKTGEVLGSATRKLNAKDFGMYYGKDMSAGFASASDREKIDELWLGPFLFSPDRANRSLLIAPELHIDGLVITLSKVDLGHNLTAVGSLRLCE